MKRINPTIAAERKYSIEKEKEIPISSYFGEDTFNYRVMEDKLPKDVFKKVLSIIESNGYLDLETANIVAHAMKEWALEKGATHFAHWFQPMTGVTAEKHDAFIEPIGRDEVIERFSGKQLAQGEPDASSFPSGGIRATFEARGYTVWDVTSPAFIRRNGIATTLCIPTAFISYTGEALDKKTPLLRSIKAVSDSAVRMLKLLGNGPVTKVFATLGPEQEYFCIDMDYYYKRQDLVLTGRTLIGAPPAKGQELEDQYFGSIRERIQSFMHDVEEELYKLGVPAKTRHNEVAPSQFEIAPVFEEANVASDHNQIVMDTMKSVGRNHHLAVLLAEKPFAGINGSGKHLNWSLSDSDGNNLLNPGDTPHENIKFLVFLTATIKAVYRHADILRASVATSGNDHRLGANEAPPAIISVFLGDQLTKILDDIEKGKATAATDKAIIDLGISVLPVLSKDNTDRNRTSPFAFTGNKFEFRAVGSNQSISFSATVLNTIVAEALDEIYDKIKGKGSDVNKAVMEVIRQEISEFKPVLFNGDNYTKEWEEEAAKRKLPNHKTSVEALPSLDTEKAKGLFEKYKVLSPVELKSRYHIRLERYAKDIDIEAKALSNMVTSQIIPAALRFQGEMAKSLKDTAKVLGDADLAPQKKLLGTLCGLIGAIETSVEELKTAQEKGIGMHDELEKAKYCNDTLKPLMLKVRQSVDELEPLVCDELWPIPKFWEMLFIC
ncbi:MAG: glutamine synthetase III [Spirochaetes bacterium]|nr:glutamine synthetase III [Spirochaetota bacterium]